MARPKVVSPRSAAVDPPFSPHRQLQPRDLLHQLQRSPVAGDLQPQPQAQARHGVPRVLHAGRGREVQHRLGAALLHDDSRGEVQRAGQRRQRGFQRQPGRDGPAGRGAAGGAEPAEAQVRGGEAARGIGDRDRRARGGERQAGGGDGDGAGPGRGGRDRGVDPRGHVVERRRIGEVGDDHGRTDLHAHAAAADAAVGARQVGQTHVGGRGRAEVSRAAHPGLQSTEGVVAVAGELHEAGLAHRRLEVVRRARVADAAEEALEGLLVGEPAAATREGGQRVERPVGDRLQPRDLAVDHRRLHRPVVGIRGHAHLAEREAVRLIQQVGRLAEPLLGGQQVPRRRVEVPLVLLAGIDPLPQVQHRRRPPRRVAGPVHRLARGDLPLGLGELRPRQLDRTQRVRGGERVGGAGGEGGHGRRESEEERKRESEEVRQRERSQIGRGGARRCMSVILSLASSLLRFFASAASSLSSHTNRNSSCVNSSTVERNRALA